MCGCVYNSRTALSIGLTFGTEVKQYRKIVKVLQIFWNFAEFCRFLQNFRAFTVFEKIKIVF